MVDTLKRLLQVGRKKHKFDSGSRILFLDYRVDNTVPEIDEHPNVRKLAGYVTRRSYCNGKPVYNVVLFNTNQGLLRNVPERNLEMYSEPVDI